MAKKCAIKIEGKACEKKAVKTYQNSATEEKKSFCEEHGPWLLPLDEGTWGEMKEKK